MLGERTLAAQQALRGVASRPAWAVQERPSQESEWRAYSGTQPRTGLPEGVEGGLAWRQSPDAGRNRAASSKSVDDFRNHSSAVDRLTCADLPPDLTSHARQPATGPGGTFGLDATRSQVEWMSREHQAAPKGSVLINRTPVPAPCAGKEGTRPWPSSPHDSS